MKLLNRKFGHNYLEIQGFGQRSYLKSIEWPFAESLISVKRSFCFPFLVFSPFSDPVEFHKKLSIKSRVRQNLLRVTKAPKLLLSPDWMKFKLIYRLPLDKARAQPMGFGVESFQHAYVSREVARVGFLIDRIDNTLEYDLTRNWERYKVLFTRARIEIYEKKWPSRQAQTKAEALELIENLEVFLPDNYISEQPMRPRALENSVCPRLSFIGSVQLSLGEELKDSYIENWKLLEIKEAQVLHGKFAYSKGVFYLDDNSKIPSFGSSFNSWPGYIYQRQDGTYITDVVESKSNSIQEGILLGGTKNWMHFVIEDLPRIILFNRFINDKSIPLIVSSELGPQILDSIRALAHRPVMKLTPQSNLLVHNLHLLHFTNPLRLTMAGDKNASSVLFDQELLFEARKLLRLSDQKDNHSIERVLIRREKGLFRPLINGSKLQVALEKRFGFSTHYLSELSLQEALNIFASAQIVVGEYGAGLANIIFCKAGSSVIEIRGGLESDSKEYQLLAESLGLDHSVQIGKNHLFSKYGISRGPYSIEIKLLTKLIEQKLNLLNNPNRMLGE